MEPKIDPIAETPTETTVAPSELAVETPAPEAPAETPTEPVTEPASQESV